MAWIRWYVGPRGKVARVQWRDPKTGRIGTRTLGPVTEEAAALALQDVEMRVEGKAPRPDEVASTDALGRFLAFLRVRGRRADTVAYYQRILTETFDAMAGTPMRLWHRGLFEVYIASHAKAWSPRTIQTRVNASRALIGWAKASSLNVGDYVAGFRGPEVRAKERPHYTADGLRRLIHGARRRHVLRASVDVQRGGEDQLGRHGLRTRRWKAPRCRVRPWAGGRESAISGMPITHTSYTPRPSSMRSTRSCATRAFVTWPWRATRSSSRSCRTSCRRASGSE